jgi:uncharacterized membrane protein YwaF
MYFGSPFYIGSLVLLVVLAGLVWAALRRRSTKCKRTVVLILMLLNIAQHFLKPLIYPQYWGTGFSSIVSAYNMCAVLIISSPFVLLWGGKFAKNFVYFTGSVAGIAAVAVPFWYIGMDVSELGWDYARFYICHALLFITSLMPLVLGLYRPRWQEFWQVGLGFFLALGVILVNDVIFVRLGLYPGTDSADLYGSLVKLNPCGVMAPPEGLPWLEGIVGLFTPACFRGIPFLWYAIPLYLGVSFIALVLFLLADRTGLRIRRHRKRR